MVWDYNDEWKYTFDSNDMDSDNDEYSCRECGAGLDDLDLRRYHGLCPDCFIESDEFTDTLTLDNAMKISDGADATIDLNHFLSFAYSKEEIEEILLQDFKKLPEDKQREIIKKYATEDDLTPDEWMESLEVKV
jgi:hypothetical protein